MFVLYAVTFGAMLGLSGMLQPENLGERPLEQGGGRSGRLTFTLPRMFAQDVFGASGLRFRGHQRKPAGCHIHQ
jgi:hypothetical protein